MARQAVVLSPKDNVANALVDLKAEDSLEVQVSGETRVVKLTTDIPFGHKFSLFKIEPNSPVIKYGEVIGVSTTIVEPRDYVHIHNVVSARGRGDLEGGEK